MDDKKLELWLNFWKFLLGTFLIGVLTAVVNWQIQSREIDLKDREIILKDKEAEFREMQRLGEFVKHALAENVAIRNRFAQYFSTVTRSKELRERWVEYASLVKQEYTQQEAKKKELEELKTKLLAAQSRGESVASELKKVKSELGNVVSDLKVVENNKPPKVLPIFSSGKVQFDMIFDVDNWDESISLDILNLYSKLKANILEQAIEEFQKPLIILKKAEAPKTDENGRINLTFSIEDVSYEDLACWMVKNTDFDEIKRYQSILTRFLRLSSSEKEYKSSKVRVYYKSSGNSKKIPANLVCKNSKSGS